MVTSVLVVDDDQEIRDLIGALLLDDRISLEYASNWQTGANLLQTRHFDLAILDAILSDQPEPDLVALAANENTPILFMTRDAADAHIIERPNHCFIEKKFIRDRLPEQFARILLEHRQNTARVQASAAKMQASTEALASAIDASGRLIDAIRGEQASQMLAAEGAAGIPQALESPDQPASVTPHTDRSGLTGHLGTLVRHRLLATYEVRFGLEDDRIVVVATRDDKPVSLDFNATVRELVLIGRTIFTHSAWARKQGALVRTP